MTIFRREKSRGVEPFVYFGRHRAHYKLIADIMFGIQLDSDQPRLLSIGEDRMLVSAASQENQHSVVETGS